MITRSQSFCDDLVLMPSGCLEWRGGTDGGGYGAIWVNSEQVGTHRFAWELANGPIPDGLSVPHHCDNRPCCQTEPTEGYPEGHLFLGTDADNNADKIAKGRHGGTTKTHCPQSHSYVEANTYTYHGKRNCRACNNIAAAKYRKGKP